MTPSLVEKAKALALQAHGEQKYGDQPYSVHLQDVFGIVAAILDDEIAQAAAWLHDSIEDTSLTYKDIETLISKDVADIVAICTDPEGPNRKTRKALLHERLQKCSSVRALVVKLADRFANVAASTRTGNQSLLKMYRREHPEFKAAAYREDPRMLSIQKGIDFTLAQR